MKNQTVYDVLGIGCSAVDDLVYVDSYPPPDAKTPVLRTERQCGGLTATALVAASRLGSRCAYAGVLGSDALSSFVLERLQQEHIEVMHVVRRYDARPFHSIIIVDETQHTRNIFFNPEGVVVADAALPAADVIRSAGVLFIDHTGAEGAIRAARIAREAGIPIVGDLERSGDPQFPELLAVVDHLILSRDFARRLTGADGPAAAAARLWNPGRQAVVVTCGRDGCWYVGASGEQAAAHQPAFAVKVVDTTGCGDVFHGAYASALVRRLSLSERVRFASAAAGLKATRAGGQAGIPTRAAVEAFLQEEPHADRP